MKISLFVYPIPIDFSPAIGCAAGCGGQNRRLENWYPNLVPTCHLPLFLSPPLPVSVTATSDAFAAVRFVRKSDCFNLCYLDGDVRSCVRFSATDPDGVTRSVSDATFSVPGHTPVILRSVSRSVASDMDDVYVESGFDTPCAAA